MGDPKDVSTRLGKKRRISIRKIPFQVVGLLYTLFVIYVILMLELLAMHYTCLEAMKTLLMGQ